MIPYGRQYIDQDDIDAVVEVLRSDWLTTGPKVEEFEEAVTGFVGAPHGVAVSNGTAALHAAMFAIGIGPGDEVIVPPITFAATANCVVYQGGTPVFADVEPGTLLIDPEEVARKITPRTKAVIAVDYCGQPADYDALAEITRSKGIWLVADGCHALGARYKGRKVGTLADLTVFSFHPVKHIATGEGGMIVTKDSRLASRMRQFRNHGIDMDFRARQTKGSWYYQITQLGYNYRLTDMQCALGISQLKKMPWVLRRRTEIAQGYNRAFKDNPTVRPLVSGSDVYHAYHLYVVKVLGEDSQSQPLKLRLFHYLRENGIGVNLHYIPVYWHPMYEQIIDIKQNTCSIAESAYHEIMSLPIFPHLKQEEFAYVVEKIKTGISDL